MTPHRLRIYKLIIERQRDRTPNNAGVWPEWSDLGLTLEENVMSSFAVVGWIGNTPFRNDLIVPSCLKELEKLLTLVKPRFHKKFSATDTDEDDTHRQQKYENNKALESPCREYFVVAKVQSCYREYFVELGRTDQTAPDSVCDGIKGNISVK